MAIEATFSEGILAFCRHHRSGRQHRVGALVGVADDVGHARRDPAPVQLHRGVDRGLGALGRGDVGVDEHAAVGRAGLGDGLGSRILGHVGEGDLGTATDEDGDLAASLAWSSSLDGAIGSGASFSTTTLSLGSHTITASVTDSGGTPNGGDDTSATQQFDVIVDPRFTATLDTEPLILPI